MNPDIDLASWMQATPAGRPQDQELHLEKVEQVRIALTDPLHRWFTGTVVGRDPSQEDLLWHWVRGGGAAWYRRERAKRQSPEFPGDP